MSTTAVDVSKFQTPSPDSLSSQLSSAIDRIYNTAEANSAASAAQAQDLRNWQQQQTQKQMDFNAAEAQKNRDWQQYMSNTAHQREVADLKAAGLNPILSASGGNGASVTSGATASASAPSGAKGEVDTSANAAIIQLLGSFLNAQNNMEMQRMSAVTNQSIAERNNASAQLIAAINGEYGNQRAHISGQYGYASARYSADTSRANAITAAIASMLNSERSASSAESIQASKEAHDEFMARNYPQSPTGAISGTYKKFEDMANQFLDALAGKRRGKFGSDRYNGAGLK